MQEALGNPIPNEYFIPSMKSYVQESLVDVLTGATVPSVNGYTIRTKTPLEIFSSMGGGSVHVRHAR